jgi:transcriptional regulator with XRE-family HTH domain
MKAGMPDTSPAVRLARLVESGALDHGALGSLLGARRRALGRSQYRVAQQLCAAAGAATVSRHEVSRWERGERVPTAYWRRHLGRVLGLPAELLDAAAARARGTGRAGTGRAANSRTGNETSPKLM